MNRCRAFALCLVLAQVLFGAVDLARALPFISDVSPVSGAPGTSVFISGSGFSDAIDVQFNIASGIFNIVSDDLITTTVPLDATTGPIAVTTVTGVAVTFGSFVVAPRITSLFPAQGPLGAHILINGENFEGATFVLFSNTNSAFAVNSQSQIEAVVPAGATSGPISVYTDAGHDVSAQRFLVTGPEPFINSFSPTQGKPGDGVIITGLNFSGAVTVRFGGTNAQATVTSTTQISTRVPNGAPTGPISVSNASGTNLSANIFTVTTAPVVQSFTPIAAGPGTDVVVDGLNFDGATQVRFGSTPAQKLFVTASSQLHATVPNGATNGPISVVTPLGTGTSSFNFIASGQPIITDFSPLSGFPNSNVTLNGYNFATVTVVGLGGVSAGFSITAPTQINVRVPSNATNGIITVYNASGSASTLVPFLIRTGKPILTGFTPDAGVPRDKVIISGLDLSTANKVTFNGLAAQANVVADTQISAVVPDNATSGPITVSTAGGSVTSVDRFIVAARPAGFTPASGPAGTLVKVFGINLTDLTDVRFNGAGAAFNVSSTNALTTSVPDAGTTGSISLTSAAGIVATTNYFVVVPLIRSVTPISGVGGTTVTVNGTGFGDVVGVMFNGIFSPGVYVLSTTQLLAAVPSNASSGPLVVVTEWGTATNARPFIIGPASDLVLNQKVSTTAALANQIVTYTTAVTNRGPDSASAIILSNSFSGTFNVLSVAASQGRIARADPYIRVDVGTLPTGEGVVLTVTGLAGGSNIVSFASVSAHESDPAPESNVSIVQTTVGANPATLQIAEMPANVQISWPLAATNFVLQFTDNLSTGTRWQGVLVAPSIVGTQKVVTLPTTAPRQIYRLSRP